MPSSSWRVACLAALLVTAAGSRAEAQQQARGFGVERLYPSAPGGGWVVMDALDMRGDPGGVVGLSLGYAHVPLRVVDRNGDSRLTVVSAQASADFGFAATYDRWRVYLNLDMPLGRSGSSGVVSGYQLTGPSTTLGSNPDVLTDPRIGFDARILGEAGSALRVGAGAQLFVPSGNRADYDTDDTYRAMARLLVAGDIGRFTYAGHLGAHVRPLDDSPAPGSPRGTEMLFGAAAGVRLLPCGSCGTALIVGPEIYGATAFRSFLGTNTTALEGLLGARLEGTADDGPQVRVKLGTGVGINHHFGAAEWRFVLGIELFDHHRKTRAPEPL
ncbi:MAG: outer membrane protein OmpA [Labilithrix sp.]|nr:outer membrane protein OmpA [Labilithrix sp.]